MAENQEALLQILLEDAMLEGDQEKLNRMLELADELRTKGSQDLSDKGFMAGRVYVPPSPWQGMGNLASTIRGEVKDWRAGQLRDDMSKRRGDMRQGYLSQLLRKPSTPMQPFPDMAPEE